MSAAPSSLKFSANISWLFTELPALAERVRAAAARGFPAVECAWPYEADVHELRRARDESGVDVVLINTPPGDVQAGELGLGAVPGRESDFRKGVHLALQYARALDCKRIHLMAGRVPIGSDRSTVASEMEAVFVNNLRYAADLLSEDGVLGLIEPINTRITDPRYFLDSPHQAAAILEKVGKDNIKLQMDVYHWQIMDGNLTQNIHKYFHLISHVQVAQVPGRNEPDSAGEVNYDYVFSTLQQCGYQGYVGCEYKPLGQWFSTLQQCGYQGYVGCEYKPLASTDEGLGWLKDHWTRTV